MNFVYLIIYNQTGRRYGCETAVLRLVLDAVRRLEATTSNTSSKSIASSQGSHDTILDWLEKEYTSLLSTRRNSHATVAEATFWCMRGLLVLSVAALVLFLFLHDY